MKLRKPVVLVVLDGWGFTEREQGNAVLQAVKPQWNHLWDRYPHTFLKASGEDVGLPPGQMGNSEVGHLNLGAGRIVYQDLTRITLAIEDGSFFKNPVLCQAVQRARDNDRAVHLMGLLSDGGVHSHIKHLFALIDLAVQQGQRKFFVHAFLDGRDVPPANALEYIDALEEKLSKVGTGAIATVMGRYYAMDRDRRWERTARAYKAMVYGDGIPVESARQAVEKGYRREETDEFIQPSVVVKDGEPVVRVADGDEVIFFNFRPDRARQLTRAFTDRDFKGFDRGPHHPDTGFTCFTQYDKTIEAPVAFEPETIKNTLGEVLSRHGLKQLRLAETEKYAHVTFFFNGGVETPNPGEERILVPSPQVATYDLRPQMSAFEVTDTFLTNFHKFDVIIMNYANPDMVGHTGKIEATLKAIEAVDECLGRVVPAVLEKGGTLLITGDHGNAERLLDEDGSPHTAHTDNPVPFLLVAPDTAGITLKEGSLRDVAPTMLDILGIPQPEEMTGTTLIKEGQ
ncbi:MAG: 2,3-bisphosphoglycerate-independent phosphoglycerate mutase [Peptococcaceae bacterium]|nr:2,3-bisphosphoglycerate-independent phosphoglycerate mutase [Peptococcaceae bacterium]